MQVGEVPRLAIPMKSAQRIKLITHKLARCQERLAIPTKSAQQMKLITCKLARCQERLGIPMISSADKLNYMQVD